MGLKHLLPFLSLCFFCHSFTPSTICFPALPNRKGERTKIIPGVALPPGQLRRKKTKKKNQHHTASVSTSCQLFDICAISVSRETSCRLIPVLCYTAARCSGPIGASRHYGLRRANQSVPSRLVCLHTVQFASLSERFFFLTLCFLSEKSCGRQTQPDFCCLSARDSDWLITIKRLQS